MRQIIRAATVFLALAIPCATLPAFAQNSDTLPVVTWLPAQPDPGSIVQILVHRARIGPDSITSITGLLSGEPLHFDSSARTRLRALGGIPVGATDSARAQIVIHRKSGIIDTVAAAIPLRVQAVQPAGPPRERLSVAPQFGREPDSALAARIARESAMALAVSRRSHETPRLWRGYFARPRPSRITSRFGGGREFNGQVRSRHSGVDFAGATGTPVRVSNRGVVALVADFHLAGRAVYVDHGAGLVTAYFHLSKINVAEGDTVVRGEIIGRVGQSGRVTGPHLHWVARYGEVSVNALTLLAIDPPPPVKKKPAARRPSD
ncbi:MAG: M23 family metallopeptidase [Gemmatimonadaceae bacterium]|nr:M23 family metallopeptidase [Gemmatimonadaceae bacterium]